MGEGIFSELATTKQFTYDDIDGIKPITFTYKLLSMRDHIEAQNYEPKEESVLYLIYISIKDNLDKEITVKDIEDLPGCLVEHMLMDILEFNNIDVDKLENKYMQ